MFIFECFLVAAVIVLLIAFVVIWDGLTNGLHPFDEDGIEWPVGHELYEKRKRAEWVKRMRDEK